MTGKLKIGKLKAPSLAGFRLCCREMTNFAWLILDSKPDAPIAPGELPQHRQAACNTG